MTATNPSDGDSNEIDIRRRPCPELTSVQMKDMERLWRLQQPNHQYRLQQTDTSSSYSSNHQDHHDGPHQKKQRREKDTFLPEGMDHHGYECVKRVHSFCLSFLEKQQQQWQHGDHHGNDNLTTSSNPNNNPLLKFLKDDPQQSGLFPYYDHFFGIGASGGRRLRLHRYGGGGTNNSIDFDGDGGKQQHRQNRTVLTLHYDSFMDEMNRFEFQIHHKLPDMYLQAALGAHLHFFPLQALPAVNVAMALAVATLWRKLHVTSFQQQHPSSSHIGSTATAQPPLLVNLNHFLDSCVLVARFIHVYPQLPMASVKTGLVHKFISIKGHVIKARPRRLRVAYAEFTCQKCSTVIPQTFEKGQFDVPTSCINQSCRSRSFVMERSTARYTNVQEIRLQEAQDESTAHAGRTPRQIDVEVTDDLIDACRPGDIVLLACYVDVVNSAIAAGRAGKRANESSTYKLFLQGHSITSLSETSNKSSQQSQQSSMSMSSSGAAKQSTFTQAQLQNIVQLCHADHRCLGEVERRAFPFDLLVRSLCPSIIGHHSVKAGILLCLLGGTPPSSSQMDRGATIRSNSHILIVGDPGMGKSQMLLAATQLAARSVYVGGNTSSTTGLTVTMTKEEGGETGIEAGALVLADQGVACIDELDKCKHLDGLLEAMEQQSVSIAKAGVVASLPSRCSVIAAANPKHGSYNMSKTVAENLNMARPILSRFDLIFILRDRADKVQDQLVSSNILNIYTDHGLAPPIQQCDVNASNDAMRDPLYRSLLKKTSNGNSEDCNDDTKNDPNRISMEKRLEWVASFNDPLPAELVRDYIAYAREYCHPKLTTKAAFILRDYYLSLRYPSHGKQRRDTVPITTRQLEALIRLSQARAKACLREFVLEEDAKDVVELLKCSNLQVHTDEFGLVDVSRGGAGGQSNRKVRKEFVKRLYDIVGENGVCDKGDLLRIADHVDMGRSDFETTIEELRLNGTLMRQSDGKYKVLP